MAQYNFICFDCRRAARRDTPFNSGVLPLCPDCKQPMFNAGSKGKPPARSDQRAWEEFKRISMAIRGAPSNGPGYWLNRRIAKNQTEIARLEKLPRSETRIAKTAKLRREVELLRMELATELPR